MMRITKQLDLTLTISQHELIRRIIGGNKARPFVTPQQRSAIQQLCAAAGRVSEPEKFLIEFKIALVEAANLQRLPYGVERSAMLSRLVSVFIDELYSAGNSEVLSDSRIGEEKLATAPRLILENDSPGARL